MAIVTENQLIQTYNSLNRSFATVFFPQAGNYNDVTDKGF